MALVHDYMRGGLYYKKDDGYRSAREEEEKKCATDLHGGEFHNKRVINIW